MVRSDTVRTPNAFDTDAGQPLLVVFCAVFTMAANDTFESWDSGRQIILVTWIASKAGRLIIDLVAGPAQLIN